MHLEIITPEKILLSQEVDVVTFPGSNGEFQILDNHAPLVSTLSKGNIKLSKNVDLDEKIKSQFKEVADKLTFKVDGGVVECKENKVIVLVD